MQNWIGLMEMLKFHMRKRFSVCGLRLAMRYWTIWFICSVAVRFQSCAGHGRLIEPPSRASAWRYGFQTPPDYNDHELYCGGFTRQWKRNGGKCGECGDAWDTTEPRAHEYGGQWGQGVIVRKYAPGAEMLIRIELTASHMGYFEFRICPEPNAKQDCLDRHLLKILGGTPSQPAPSDLDTRFYPRNGSRIYEIKAQLPDLECSQCVLQWRYIAGNNWGICPDGNGAVGCGPQEEFRACSDIALGEGIYTPIRPIRPTSRTTVRPKAVPASTEPTQAQDETPEGTDSTPIVVTVVILLLLLFVVIAWYLHRNKSEAIKKWIQSTEDRFCKRQQKSNAIVPTPTKASVSSIFANTPGYSVTKSDHEKNSILSPPPVPPPRTKRQTRIKEMSPDESSIA